MDVSKDTILDIVYDTLDLEQIKRSFIYWDSRIRKRDEEISAGLMTIAMPFDGMLVFVDLAPNYNWAHPSLFLFVSTEDLRTEVVEASFTPYLDGYPDTVTIILTHGKEPPHGRYFQIFNDQT